MNTVDLGNGLTLREGPYYVYVKEGKGLGPADGTPHIAWFDGTKFKNIQVLGAAQYYDHDDFSEFVELDIPEYLYKSKAEEVKETVSK